MHFRTGAAPIGVPVEPPEPPAAAPVPQASRAPSHNRNGIHTLAKSSCSRAPGSHPPPRTDAAPGSGPGLDPGYHRPANRDTRPRLPALPHTLASVNLAEARGNKRLRSQSMPTEPFANRRAGQAGRDLPPDRVRIGGSTGRQGDRDRGLPRSMLPRFARKPKTDEGSGATSRPQPCA